MYADTIRFVAGPSLIISIVGMLLLFVIGAAKRQSNEDLVEAHTVVATARRNSLSKVCPFCSESIKATAIVCRYCNRDVPPPPATVTRDELAEVQQRFPGSFAEANEIMAQLPEPPADPALWCSELCSRIDAGSTASLAAQSIPLDWNS
jgi:hypothetical protein